MTTAAALPSGDLPRVNGLAVPTDTTMATRSTAATRQDSRPAHLDKMAADASVAVPYLLVSIAGNSSKPI